MSDLVCLVDLIESEWDGGQSHYWQLRLVERGKKRTQWEKSLSDPEPEELTQAMSELLKLGVELGADTTQVTEWFEDAIAGWESEDAELGKPSREAFSPEDIRPGL